MAATRLQLVIIIIIIIIISSATDSHSVFIVLKKETASPPPAERLWIGVETDCFSGILGDDCGASGNLLN